MKRASCLIIFLVNLLCSCAPGIQPLLDEYNSMFDMTGDSSLEGDGVFDPTKIIPDHEYTVQRISPFSISAPAGGTVYQWKLEPSKNIDDGMDAGVVPLWFDINVYGGNTKDLVLKIPEIGLSVGTYDLSIEMTLDGKQYTDVCRLTIRGGSN